jgi:hypothetical protein
VIIAHESVRMAQFPNTVRVRPEPEPQVGV